MSFMLLGILNSQVSAAGGSYELISSQILTSSASSVTFSSIPQDYKHLQIRAVVRSTYPTTYDSSSIAMRVNGVTSSNYVYHYLKGNGSSVSSSSSGAVSFIIPADIPTAVATSNTYAGVVIDVLDYTSTSKNKTIRSLNGWHSATSTKGVSLASGMLTNSTNAITSISLTEFSFSYAFETGSRFSLYGIRG